MFQNSYQNGTYFDVFDPKNSQEKLKTLFRISNVNLNNKVFDKDLKTFVLQFCTPNAKMSLPKDQKKDLYLIQQYLVLQIFFIPGLSWNIELVISDLSKTKRRIILSSSTHKTQIKPFFVKTHTQNFKQGVWNNFVVDLYSYIEAFKGQTYRSLDSIHLTGHFKLRRIYTSTSQPIEGEGQNQSQEIKPINFLPKNYYFPIGVPYATKINQFQANSLSEAAYQTTESSTKNSSFLKPKPKNEIAKHETHKNQSKTEKAIPLRQINQIKHKDQKKIKDFLANTNGADLNRKYKEDEKSEQGASPLIPSAKTVKSIDKYVKKKNLIKTQQMPPKARSSLQKASVVKKTFDNSAAKAKLNPWRSNNTQTNGSEMQVSKQQEERSVDTPQTISIFKTNHNLGTKLSETKHPDRKSDNYSDSQYVELSQKFSTLTDGKFFKCSQLQQQISNDLQSRKQQDQIEENIEMETNSIHSSANNKEHKIEQEQEQIIESICDSLDRIESQDRHKMGSSSLYGFGQQLMRQFMGDLQRPYSPPIGQREHTEQQLTVRPCEQKEEVQLIYDPVLNCYYDHKTHTYYQLKN